MHESVLLEEAIDLLHLQETDTVVDATVSSSEVVVLVSGVVVAPASSFLSSHPTNVSAIAAESTSKRMSDKIFCVLVLFISFYLIDIVITYLFILDIVILMQDINMKRKLRKIFQILEKMK